MVKDSRARKPAKAVKGAEMPRRAQKGFVATGRPPGDPLDIRSERLVLRVHPDLLEVLTECAAAARMTRSLYVEQILLLFLNIKEDAQLDSIGRKKVDAEIRPPEKAAPKDAGTDWLEDPPKGGLAGLRAAAKGRVPPTRPKKGR
ncbi:MAG: hypothetical protein CFE29_04535 [Bradyrhizobiaceae bacterium PARB1]|jgi:hypothetical protein|nr:MAG: hypothetical protein CFE29_04535 [Bradyrhizobiaceae bacterium PARB1]